MKHIGDRLDTKRDRDTSKSKPYMPNIVPFGCSDINSPQYLSSGLTIREIEDKLAGPIQVAWTVSRKCNFQCTHCYNNSGPHVNEGELPIEPIIDNLTDAAPFNVCLCGGEPFAWGDLLYDICRKLRCGGIPGVSLVTNASLATADNVRRAFDNGLRQIQISVDGITEAEHGVFRTSKGSFRAALAAIRNSIRIAGGEAVCVAMAPSKYNIASFAQYVSMMIDLGITVVRVQPFMPIGRGAYSYQDCAPTAAQYLSLQRMIADLTHTYMKEGTRIFIDWGDPLEHIWYYTETEAMPDFASIQTNGWYEASPYIPVQFCDLTKHSLKEAFVKARKSVWSIKIMRTMAKTLSTLNGMSTLKPRIYFEDPILIDCFDEAHWELAKNTDDISTLLAYAEEKGLYSTRA